MEPDPDGVTPEPEPVLDPELLAFNGSRNSVLVVAMLRTPLRHENAVNCLTHLASWLGDPDGLPWLGSRLFKFWQR